MQRLHHIQFRKHYPSPSGADTLRALRRAMLSNRSFADRLDRRAAD